MLEPPRNNPVGANLNFSPKTLRLNFPRRRSAAHNPENPAPAPPFMKFQGFSRGLNMTDSIEKTPQSAAKPTDRMDQSKRGPFAGGDHTK